MLINDKKIYMAPVNYYAYYFINIFNFLQSCYDLLVFAFNFAIN